MALLCSDTQHCSQEAYVYKLLGFSSYSWSQEHSWWRTIGWSRGKVISFFNSFFLRLRWPFIPCCFTIDTPHLCSGSCPFVETEHELGIFHSSPLPRPAACPRGVVFMGGPTSVFALWLSDVGSGQGEASAGYWDTGRRQRWCIYSYGNLPAVPRVGRGWASLQRIAVLVRLNKH